jgi:hypothetical protein
MTDQISHSAAGEKEDDEWIVFEGNPPPMSEARRQLILRAYRRQFPAPSFAWLTDSYGQYWLTGRVGKPTKEKGE